jgi:hypothetical protein
MSRPMSRHAARARSMLRNLVALGLLAAAGQVVANQVQIGQPLQISLPASNFTNAVFVDVPDGAERLNLRFDAADPAQNIAMLVRHGSPFPVSGTPGVPTDVDWLLGHAHYLSLSSGGRESIVITPAGRQPLRGGRWYFSLLNLSGQPSEATLHATLGAASDFVPIEMVFDDTRRNCNVSGWNDATPRNAENGNTGTTLGQQRRLAAQEAARILSNELRPNAPIRVQVCWSDDLPDTTLAQAGPRYVFAHDPGSDLDDSGLLQIAPYLGERHLVQFGAAAVHQAGTSLCSITGSSCQNPPAEAVATFNTKIDARPNVNQQFDYGFVHGGSFSKPSFISVALHEIAHGLGFLGNTQMRADGSTPQGSQNRYFEHAYDDAYGHHARYVQGSSARDFLRLSNQERVAAITSGTGLRFAGERTVDHPQNAWRAFTPPTSHVQLHAPATVAPGSTYSHLHPDTQNPVAQLMTASINSSAPRSLGLAQGVFEDIGFSAAPKAVPAAVAPLQSQYFDVARNGHGFEMRRVTGIPGVDDLYFVIFYSYDDAGRPQFFNAVGRVVDGVFLPARNEFGDSLVQTRYLGPGQTVADSDPAFTGEVRIDFVDAARHPVCRDGAAGRAEGASLAVLAWTLGSQRRQWCVQPLVEGRAGVQMDFSNQWWNPDDAGWGMSVLSFPGQGGDGLGLQLYFPDAQGNGRWALVQTPTYTPGGTYPVLQPIGYCRTCAAPGELQFQQIGTLTIDLRAPGSGPSTVSVNVTYAGPEGGSFVRNNTTIVPVGTPGYGGN